jgi:hypothetical protein
MSFVSTKTNTNLPIGASSHYEAGAQVNWLPLILFIFAAIYLLPSALNVNGTIGSFLFDDGIRLDGAERVLQGQIPYRDFYAIYGPAQFYWLPLLLKIFGVQSLTLRANFLFFTALGGVAIFTFCRKIAVSLPSSLLAYFGFLLPRAYIDPPLALLFLDIDENRVGDHICYYSNRGKMKSHYPNWAVRKDLQQIVYEIASAWMERSKAIAV